MRQPSARALLLALLAIVPALVLVSGAGGTSERAIKQPPRAVPDELIVRFKAGVTDEQANALLAAAGAVGKKKFEKIRARVAKIDPALVERALKKLSSDPRVEYAERNYIVQATLLPNDPSFGQLWGLRNTGQSVGGTRGTADADIDADEAWDIGTGSTAVVAAVIDTGVDFRHPDLGGSLQSSALMWINPGENCSGCRIDGVDNDGNGHVDDWRGWDFVGADNNPVDDHDHGTHVAGTIGALGDNGVGVVGVNWRVKLMALKFLDATGSGTTADAVSAILYAASKGAHVMNNSWGGGGYSQALRDAVAEADRAGSLFVAAAGNDGTDNDATPMYPASYEEPNVVAVAATDSTDGRASFSNYGRTSVDLGAPGVDVYSTVRGGYARFSGTSMATPHVAGTAALAKAIFPGATAVGLKALLLGTTNAIAALAGKSVSGGRLNAGSAVRCANAPKLVVEAPRDGFAAATGEPTAVAVIAADCALPGGVAVAATVNGAALALTPRGDGLYTGTFTPAESGPLTLSFTASAGGTSVGRTVSGTARDNYRFADAPFAWIDATAGGTNTGLRADDKFVQVSLPFSFSYFGRTYSSVKISSNGMLVLGADPADAFENSVLPDGSPPNGVIAPFWDDLNTSSVGAIWRRTVGSAPNRRFVVAWIGVPHFFVGGAVTFQAILEEGGGIVFQYRDTKFGDRAFDDGASASVGVEDGDGAVGRQFLFEEPALGPYENAKALRFTYGTGTPPPDSTAPATPSGLTATPGDGRVSLDWADNTEPDLAGYPVYRKNADGTWTRIAAPTASAYTDTGLTNGVAYNYRVASIDTSDNESAPTAEVSAVPNALPSGKSYRPSSFTVVAGSVYSGNLSRLYSDDGSRLVISSGSVGGLRVADFYASATIAASDLATLRTLRIDYDGSANYGGVAITLRVYNWTTGAWETVDGPRTGVTADRPFSWSTSSPDAYVSPTGQVRFDVRGERSGSGFRTRTDLIGFTVWS